MSTKWIWALIGLIWIVVIGCVTGANAPQAHEEDQETTHTKHAEEGLSIDSSTGIPFAYSFRHPVAGFTASDYGFGFGLENHWFCMASAPDGTCVSYGIHLGRDTQVARTPAGTEVRAPADGIVRIATDIRFGGYGSDHRDNADYTGCVVVLEHLLGTGEAVTTLLGHLECGSGPAVGALVARGDVVGRIGHYWHGARKTIDWHHVHWAMRKGRFTAQEYRKSDLLPYVQGYAPISECSVDPATGALTHPRWIDPFVILAANSDTSITADSNVRHHPSGSFLQDPDGGYWIVQNDTTIARVPSGVARSNRYPTGDAIPVTHEEIGCYHQAPDIASEGLVTLYVRPGGNAVVMAYHDTKERYDLITWEAFLSWGFQEGDISQGVQASVYEEQYQDRGFRLLRPGTLVKAHEESEVSIITMQQTRLPIASERAFERAGFKWNRITSVPASVITDIAGPRENRALTENDLLMCAVSPECPGGTETCGGGGFPEPEPEQEPDPEPEPVFEPAPNPEPIPEPEPEPISEPESESTEEEDSDEPPVSESEPIPVPEPDPAPVPPQTVPPAPEPEPDPVPVSAVPPPLTIRLTTLVNMDGFSLWLLAGALYATPTDTAQDCTVTTRSATCTVAIDPSRTLEFWMYTGVPNTPWSPGLSWETNACDPFADVSVWRGDTPVLLQMIQVGDGCHFLVEGE